MHGERTVSRRALLALAGAALARGAEPVIDIHQHTNYSGRTDEQLIAHQRAMGIAKTVLLPAGEPSPPSGGVPSTHSRRGKYLGAEENSQRSS
jgi:hypothetical protein